MMSETMNPDTPYLSDAATTTIGGEDRRLSPLGAFGVWVVVSVAGWLAIAALVAALI